MNESLVLAFLATLVRASAFLFSAPLLGDHIFSRRIRGAFAVLIAIPLAGLRPVIHFEALPYVLLCDGLLGLLAGFTLRTILGAADTAGELLGIKLGLGFAATFDPAHGETSSTARQLVSTLAGIAFIMGGALPHCIRVIAYLPSQLTTAELGFSQLIAESGQMMAASLRLIAPLLAASFLANIGLALASRAAPSLNLFSVMLPAMLLTGILILLAGAPLFTHELTQLVAHALDALTRLTGVGV